MVNGAASLERLPRPGIVTSDDEIYPDDLGPVDKSPDGATPDGDEIVDQVGVIKGRADAALVVGRLQIEDEVEVASHAWFCVNGERPRTGHVVTDGQTVEPIEDLTFGVHGLDSISSGLGGQASRAGRRFLPGALARAYRSRVRSGSAGLAALVAVVWGLCFVVIQASLPSPAPLFLAALRALIGGGVLAAWIQLGRWRSGSRRQDADRADRAGVLGPAGPELKPFGLPSILLLVALALTNVALAFGAMYLAAGRAEAAVASILAGGQPLVLAAAGWALFSEQLSPRVVAGLAVAMAGVVLVATTSTGSTRPDGVGLALLATIAPAVGTILMRRLAPSVDLLLTTSAQFLVGGAILLAVSALLEPWGDLSWSPATLAGLLFLGVLGTGIAYLAWFWLLDRVSLVRLGAALFLIPVTGVAAAVMTGDRPAPVVLAGIAAVLVGIGILSLGGSSEPAEGVARQTD